MDSAAATPVPVEESDIVEVGLEADSSTEMTNPSDTASASSSRVQIDSTMEPKAVRISAEEFWKVAQKFYSEFDFHKMETKIHRFPAGLRGLGDRYIVPMVVAIGPYHHGSNHLQEMEKVKHVAAHNFIEGARCPYEVIFDAILVVAADARRLYADDVVAGINDSDFANMMFRDACFLLQFMLSFSSSSKSKEDFVVNTSLRRFLFSNRDCIENDIMLLENQLPWTVVDTLRGFMIRVDIQDFVAEMGKEFQIREDLQTKSFVLDPKSSPPHLLGLLRFYMIGAPKPADGHGCTQVSVPGSKTRAAIKQVSVSSAIELAEIGFNLTASKTTEFVDMGVTNKGPFFGKLFLAPLSLDGTRACWLVNMAAFEVCTASRFKEDVRKTAVCSYIALLAMLMDREEDVHKLRSKYLVHGDHTNKEMLNFFKSLVKHLPDGGCHFARIMAKIEAYKLKWWMWIVVHKFVYKNIKTIATVLSIVGALAGVLRALFSLKQHH